MIKRLMASTSTRATSPWLPKQRRSFSFARIKYAVTLLLGAMLGASVTSAWGAWGSTTPYSGIGGWAASRLICPYGGFPDVVNDAVSADPITFPGGPAGFRFAVLLDCTEQDNTECLAGENGIRTYVDGSTGGFVIDSSSITRTDGGSFIADGFKPDMRIGIWTPLNQYDDFDGIPDGVNELKIASDSAAVTANTITIAEGTLATEGSGSPAKGWLYSSRVTIQSSGPSGCYMTDDNEVFLSAEIPLPVAQGNINNTSMQIVRDCGEEAASGTCHWSGYVTDPLNSINGSTSFDDGAQLLNHGCAAGEPCVDCIRNPDKLDKKTLDNYPAIAGLYEQYENLSGTDSSSATPPVTYHLRAPNCAPQPGDPSICATTSVGFSEKGQQRGMEESISGVILISGHSESQTLNIASTTGVIKYTFHPAPDFSCSDIDPATVRLENAAPVPGTTLDLLGNGECRAQFYRADVIANMRSADPGIADGDTYTLLAKGDYDKAGTPTPFESRDTVTITEQYNETISFVAASSEVIEPASGTTTFKVYVQVQNGSLNSTVSVDVVDTGNGTANKRDYSIASNPTKLVFDPSAPGYDGTQAVDITILSNSPNNEVDTIDLVLKNLIGPASLGTNTEHTVTIKDQ